MKKLINFVRQNSYEIEMWVWICAAGGSAIGLLGILWYISPSVSGPWQ